MKFKTDICFTGYYGHLNSGDDAFVEVASWGAKHYWNMTNNRFLAIDSRLPKTNLETKGFPLNIPKSYALQSCFLIRNTGYLISAGGSTIHSRMTNRNPKQIAVNLKRKNSKIKIGGIGVSIGPFKSSKDEKAVQDYLKVIDFISLRDQRSYEYVQSIDTPYEPINAFDLAALLPEIYNCKITVDKKKTIGISVCPYESILNGGDIRNEIRRNNRLIELLKALDKADDIHFKFFIINGNPINGDLELTKEVIKKSDLNSISIVPYNVDTKITWQEINQCNVIISTRLHAAIFACFVKTPFMLVEYHQKCTDFLDDIGYFDKYRIFDAEFNVNEKRNQIHSWLVNPSSFNLPINLDLMIEKAKLNFTDDKL